MGVQYPSMDILTYIKRNKASFEELPFNYLDALAFTWLTYFDMPEVVGKVPMEFRHWPDNPMFDKIETYHRSFVPKQSANLLRAIVASPRYQEAKLIDYAYVSDRKSALQFGAIAFDVGGKTLIAFEGTDLTYAGWREDCEMSYSDSIASYPRALSFINRISEKTIGPIILSGHSKGGNVATYCLATIEDDSRIEAVYSYEGPGFHSKDVFVDHPERNQKVVKFIPHNAVVGILLNDELNSRIVKTYTVGILQHNALKWVIKDNDFVYLKKRTMTSHFIDRSVNSWIESLPEKDKRRFSKLFFEYVEAFGPDEFDELYHKFFFHVPALLRAYGSLSDDDRQFFNGVIKKLGSHLIGAFKEGARSRAKRITNPTKQPKQLETAEISKKPKPAKSKTKGA